MNPVVASSIISLGKDLIEKISTPKNTISVPESSNPKPFVSELEDAQSTSLEKPKQIYAKLDEKELKTMLLEDPTVASFAEANPNSQIFLQKEQMVAFSSALPPGKPSFSINLRPPIR